MDEKTEMEILVNQAIEKVWYEECEVYIDGACEPVNPGGVATYGFVVYCEGKKIKEEYGLAEEPGEKSSNNVAEYTALLRAMDWLLRNGYKEVTIKSDSELLIRQMKGLYAVRAERIMPLYQKAKQAEKMFKKIEYEWVPRELNKEADRLSKVAYMEYMDNHPEVAEKFKYLMATEKQKKYLIMLGGDYHKYMSKREASREIEKLKRSA